MNILAFSGETQKIDSSEKNSVLIDKKIYDDLMTLAIALEGDSKDTEKVKMQLLKILFQDDPDMIKSIDEAWLEEYGVPL